MFPHVLIRGGGNPIFFNFFTPRVLAGEGVTQKKITPRILLTGWGNYPTRLSPSGGNYPLVFNITPAYWGKGSIQLLNNLSTQPLHIGPTCHRYGNSHTKSHGPGESPKRERPNTRLLPRPAALTLQYSRLTN